MRTLCAKTEINGTPDSIWQHIIDLSKYGEWNPLIVFASGEVSEGATIRIQIAEQSGTVKAKVLKVEPNRELIFATQLPMGLLKAKYTQRIESIGETRARYIVTEEFRGPLILLIGSKIERRNAPLYVQTCEAIKQRVESARE